MAEIPPPTYSQNPDDAGSQSHNAETAETQILIIPTVDAINFQKGYLGAEGERAAIEGELQIKGADPSHWTRITISLHTYEVAFQHEIELFSNEIEVYSRSANATAVPSTFLFAIPLMPDTPQSIQTAHSSLFHKLTATLYPSDLSLCPLVKSLTVHTRRYTSHTQSPDVSPETFALQEPTCVEVQLPRTSFTVEESIPVYITVPPPSRELVLDHGLRLRNIRVELVRVVRVRREYGEGIETDSDGDLFLEQTLQGQVDNYEIPSGAEASSSVDEHTHFFSPSKAPLSPVSSGSYFKTVIARSGASCRFHSSRSIQLRFVLHQPKPPLSPSVSQSSLASGECSHAASDAESALITQLTLLHSVTFHIKVYVAFVDVSSRVERISVLRIPITILAPPAHLPEVSASMDEAYQKKHDRPPLKTIREEEAETAPHYSEGEAGPSMHSAPPPFEERDAPPPFFFSISGSAATPLPSFLESEREIILPETGIQDQSNPMAISIPGEGVAFGFHETQQFDGHLEDMHRSLTPPPSLEMASRDPDITAFTEIHDSDHAIETLGLALDHQEHVASTEERPPPPPAMDDPSDPPPSIDSEFRSPSHVRQASPRLSPPPLHAPYNPSETHVAPTPPPVVVESSHGPAPPPYLGPEGHRDQEHVIRPPPYVD